MRILERFWSKVERRRPDECWPWLGGSVNGYGRFYLNQKLKSAPAHIIAWELENAVEFPIGLEARHTCDNPTCVNPRHIIPGTHRENVRDCVERGRHPEASRPCVSEGTSSLQPTRIFIEAFGIVESVGRYARLSGQPRRSVAAMASVIDHCCSTAANLFTARARGHRQSMESKMRTHKPANYHEFTALPAWTRAKWKGGDVLNDADPYKWSGTADPPAIGAKVTAYMNGLGVGTVVTYFAEYGWLGVKVKLDKPPAWFTKQNNNTNPAAHLFGLDLEKRTINVTK